MMITRPKAKSGLEVRTVEDEKVILDRDGEHIHQLNASASFVWERCDGSREVAEIAQELADAFEVDPELTLQDVSQIVVKFTELGLIEEVHVGKPAS